MSTTQTTKTTKSAVVTAAETVVAAAVEALAAAKTGLAEIETQAAAAAAELARIEAVIADNDLSAGLAELTAADAESRFYRLKVTAKTKAIAETNGRLREANTQLLLARLESGDYGLDTGKLKAEGEALASEIAALLEAHKIKCEAQNQRAVQLEHDLLVTDAWNRGVLDNGGLNRPRPAYEGNPESQLAWGRDNWRDSTQTWFDINGERVQPRINSSSRVDSILRRAGWIQTYGAGSATSCPIS